MTNSMHKTPVSALCLYFYLFTFVLLLMAAFRVAFWIVAASDMPDPLSRDAFKAFYIGLRFDARITALFILPLALILCVPKLAERLHKAAKPLTVFYTVLFFLLIVVYSVDFGFYAYLKSRVSSSLAFELLLDLDEAVGMVTQTYPVPLITLGVLIATAICGLIFYIIIRLPVQVSQRKSRRIAGFLLGLIFFVIAAYGQINSSLFPLRWSYAYFTTSDGITALGLNPVQSLYDTYGKTTSGFSLQAARQAYPAMAKFLFVDQPDKESLNFLRSFTARAGEDSMPLNVIIIVMESLAYPKTSFAPGNGDPTPRLRELGEESFVFHRFFANTRTTARSIFTLITGIPDINIGGTSSRNPMLSDQRVVANEFTGYDKYYLIGGNASWANIRSILGQNIDNLHILEENYWKAPRVDVWGVDDYNLFKEANELFDARDPSRPFLAIIQTVSYHSPYTVPKTPGFEEVAVSDEILRNYGFKSQKEYNSLRFSDYAVGEFIRWAKSREYYHNTIFFIFGDHGLNDNVHNMPEGYIAAGVAPWHVPLIIHTSSELGLIAPGTSLMPTGLVDVFPTAAGLTGIAYNNWTMGRDLFNTRYDDSRITYIGATGEMGPIRLIQGEYCFLANRAGERRLFRITDDATDLSAEKPELFQELQGWAEDMQATIRFMLFNNKKNRR